MNLVDKEEFNRVMSDVEKFFTENSSCLMMKVLPTGMAIFMFWEIIEDPSGTSNLQLFLPDTATLPKNENDDVEPKMLRFATINPSVKISNNNVRDLLSLFHDEIEDLWNTINEDEPREDAIFFRPLPQSPFNGLDQTGKTIAVPVPLFVAAELGFERGQEL